MSQEFEAANPANPIEHEDHADHAEAAKPAEPKRSAPRLKIPVPPDLPLDDPETGSPHRRLSTMVGFNFLLLLVTVLMLGYIIATRNQAPATATATVNAAKPEEVKSVASEVDRLKSEITGLTKKLGEMPAPPDPTPQIKSLDDKVADLGKSVAEMPARLDTLSQKVEAATKGEALVPKVDAIDKKVGALAQSVDALKAEVGTRPAVSSSVASAPAAATRPTEDVNVEGEAMGQAADLFKQGKYAEARDAFTKLQAVYPDDARVWYFSALATGRASGNWQGESERLAKVGVEKEKAGTPDHAKIDSVFSSLTAANGKDWLAYFRKQATR